MRTARWRGARCWSAATKASSSASRRSRAQRVSVRRRRPERFIGICLDPTVGRARRGGSAAPAGIGGPKSIGSHASACDRSRRGRRRGDPIQPRTGGVAPFEPRKRAKPAEKSLRARRRRHAASPACEAACAEHRRARSRQSPRSRARFLLSSSRHRPPNHRGFTAAVNPDGVVGPTGHDARVVASSVVHLELRTVNLARACSFLHQAFDWEVEQVRTEAGTYVMLELNPALEAVPGVRSASPRLGSVRRGRRDPHRDRARAGCAGEADHGTAGGTRRVAVGNRGASLRGAALCSRNDDAHRPTSRRLHQRPARLAAGYLPRGSRDRAPGGPRDQGNGQVRRLPYFVCRKAMSARSWPPRSTSAFFYDGAIVADPEGIITSGRDNETARQISITVGEPVNAEALREMLLDRRQPRWRLAEAQA